MHILDNKRAYAIALNIKNVKTEIKTLKINLDIGIIEAGDALTEYNELTKKELKLKEKFVREVHRRNDGNERIIKHHLPTDKNPKDYWITIMEDGKRISDASYEKLICHLYRYYPGELEDHSIKALFDAALHEKEISENPKQRTLERYRANFKRLVSEEFASKDIREVTPLYLKELTQKWVNSEHPKKALYMAYKGILNLIFDYCMIHGVITSNPVKSLQNKVYLKSCDLSKPEPAEKILSPEEIDRVKAEIRRRMTMKKYGRYYVNGYALLFAIETGVRVGELCAIKWSDVYENRIHIHSQQLSEDTTPGHTTFYFVPYTKNEKGISTDGRDFPLTNAIRSLLDEVKALQTEMGIRSEFIFCHEDGRWITTEAYMTFLYKLCHSLGLNVTNNHAFRMSLNSNVLIPLGISAADRAAMLGHSVETNLRFYSYARKGYLDDVRSRLNTGFNTPEVFRNTSETPKIVHLTQKKKARNS